MSNQPSFDLLLPPALPFLPTNRAYDSRSAPHSKYYQPSIIYSQPSPEHEKQDWTLYPPKHEPRWTSDTSSNTSKHIPNNQQLPVNNQPLQRLSSSSNSPLQRLSSSTSSTSSISGRVSSRSLHSSPLSSHQEEEDLSCDLDHLTINTSNINERQISSYPYSDHFEDDSEESTLYERVDIRPIGRSYCQQPLNYYNQNDYQCTRSEPTTHQSINVTQQNAHLSAHIQPFDWPSSSLVYSTTSHHGRLSSSNLEHEQGTPSHHLAQETSTNQSPSSLFIETESSHDCTYDCFASTASLSSASFSSFAASPCHSPTSPFFDTSLPAAAIGTNDPVLSAGLDIFASQLHSARIRIAKISSFKE